MQLLKLVGLFFLWVFILVLVSITWVVYGIQKGLYMVIIYLSTKFFPEVNFDLRKFL